MPYQSIYQDAAVDSGKRKYHFVALLLFFICQQLAAMEENAMKAPDTLPESFVGAWEHKKYWGKGRTNGPHHWVGVSVGENNSLVVSSGESSMDSGSRSASGSYTVLSGEGSQKKPFILDYRISKLRNSGTVGYGSNYPVDTGPAEARLYMLDGRLNIGIDRIGNFVLDKLAPGKKKP